MAQHSWILLGSPRCVYILKSLLRPRFSFCFCFAPFFFLPFSHRLDFLKCCRDWIGRV